MNVRAIVASVLLFGCLPHPRVDAAVHKGTSETAFVPDTLYVYDYASSAQLHSDLQLIVDAKVASLSFICMSDGIF